MGKNNIIDNIIKKTIICYKNKIQTVETFFKMNNSFFFK